jgi:hypothetical protein
VRVAESTTKPKWPCAPLGGEIECVPAVLNAACTAAMVGLRKLAKGGLEVGGLLFGERSNGLTRILASRPIECEHRFGPSFVLSDRDGALLQNVLADFRSDSELASLELLGCYFSHSRHGAALTERDVQLCYQYFPKPDQIALLLIPSLSGVVQGTLLARNAQGTLVTCHQFEHSELGKPRREIQHQPPRIESTSIGQVRAAKLEPPSANPVVTRTQKPGRSETTQPLGPVPIPRRAGGRSSASQVRITLLAGLLIVLLCWPNHAIPVTQIPLTLTGSDSDLVIRWDTTRPIIREALLGMVEIRDGQQQPVHLSIGPDLLRRGWITYKRRSDLVRISFTLAGHGVTVSDNAIYFAPQYKDAAPAAIEAKLLETTAPEIGVQTPETSVSAPVLADPIAVPVRFMPEKAKPENKAPSPRTPDPNKRPRAFRAPLEPVARSVAPVNTRPAILPNPPALGLDRGTSSPPPWDTLNLSFSAPHPAAVAPKSGRLIWTGQLPKHSMLDLSAQGASLGYLNGWLPKAAVHVEVRPGELIEGGMVIFTKDQSLPSESPSLSNGWNTLMYKLDAARATDLEILEAPGPANSWNHIILRNGSRSLSMIVVDWRTEQN